MADTTTRPDEQLELVAELTRKLGRAQAERLAFVRQHLGAIRSGTLSEAQALRWANVCTLCTTLHERLARATRAFEDNDARARRA